MRRRSGLPSASRPGCRFHGAAHTNRLVVVCAAVGEDHSVFTVAADCSGGQTCRARSAHQRRHTKRRPKAWCKKELDDRGKRSLCQTRLAQRCDPKLPLISIRIQVTYAAESMLTHTAEFFSAPPQCALREPVSFLRVFSLLF